MLAELAAYSFITAFVAATALGHVLIARALLAPAGGTEVIVSVAPDAMAVSAASA